MYFVSFRVIDSIAARFAGSGVLKSGSPAPKFRTSTPEAFKAFALFITATVDDGLSESTR